MPRTRDNAISAHPAADLFPLLTGAEFDALVADIKANGLLQPIVLFDGAILDGRNRYRACLAAGVAPGFVAWHGRGNPAAYVISQNLHRRHLNESQRAMVAAKLAKLPVGSNQHASIEAPSQENAAELLNVSRSAVQRAAKVRDHGTPELVAAVERGEVAVSRAAAKVAGRAQTRKKPKATKPGTAVPLAQQGKNPERIQRMQLHAQIFGHVRDALMHLTSLPLPRDAVAICRQNPKMLLVVQERVARARAWLTEFELEWTNVEHESTRS